MNIINLNSIMNRMSYMGTKLAFQILKKSQDIKNLEFPFKIINSLLKLVSAIFHQMIALQKLWKMFFIRSKKLFSFSSYSYFCISIFPLFLPVSHCFRAWSKIDLKVYDVINCLSKNIITHFVWYLEKEKRHDIKTLSIDRVLNKEHFYGKIMLKMCTES